jgi:hypothetical protein
LGLKVVSAHIRKTLETSFRCRVSGPFFRKLLERASSGQYLLDGLDVSGQVRDELAAIRSSKIGFVFQIFNLPPSPRLSTMWKCRCSTGVELRCIESRGSFLCRSHLPFLTMLGVIIGVAVQ